MRTKTVHSVVGATLIGLLFATAANAQVLSTAETGGQGNSALLLTGNRLAPACPDPCGGEGLRLVNTNIQYSYGINDKLDILLIIGNISALRHSQTYVGLGWNARLLSRKQALVDISFFNTINVALNRRDQASTLLLTPALVISRTFKFTDILFMDSNKSKNVTLYTGLNWNIPVGAVQNKLFTPPETALNVPIGLNTGVGGKWSLYAEYDFGRSQQLAGVGLLRTF